MEDRKMSHCNASTNPPTFFSIRFPEFIPKRRFLTFLNMSLAFGFKEATLRKVFKDGLLCHLAALAKRTQDQSAVIRWVHQFGLLKCPPKKQKLWKKSCSSLGLVSPTRLDTVFIPRFCTFEVVQCF